MDNHAQQIYDVVVVGGGPVGLLTAYQMARFGLSVCIVEQYKKEEQDLYGRAIALFPRTLEQLDQLDLIEPMLQTGFACRTSVTYKDGKRVLPGRVWTFMENIKDTVYDFALVLRQRYTEDIFRKMLESVGATYMSEEECRGFEIDETAPTNQYPVTSKFTNKSHRELAIRSKYLVGADGGRSFVRRHAQIAFEGDSTEDKWIRVDGIVETDMPITRAIESKTHGNILWAPLDHGATRIGYAYTAEIAAKYPGGVTEEIAVQEAIEAMRPFTIKFVEVHWWTVYTIGQRIAQKFSFKDRVFLCGDACHTHSSGAAQGLNTGIHDAVNLGWKLALSIRGMVKPDVLKTYESERQTTVQMLINYDKDISVLMSNKWPSWYTGNVDGDPHLVLGEIFEQTASFNTGLGISYGNNILNQHPSLAAMIAPGHRAADVALSTPGTNSDIRLHRVTRNVCKFWVIIFAGDLNSTTKSLRALRRSLDARAAGLLHHEAIGWLTISSLVGPSPFELLGMEPFGDMYFDPDNTAHTRYGIDSQAGGVVILRPDGLVGSSCQLELALIESYFSGVLLFQD